jgi:hypothetical protein
LLCAVAVNPSAIKKLESRNVFIFITLVCGFNSNPDEWKEFTRLTMPG